MDSDLCRSCLPKHGRPHSRQDHLSFTSATDAVENYSRNHLSSLRKDHSTDADGHLEVAWGSVSKYLEEIIEVILELTTKSCTIIPSLLAQYC